MKVELHIAGHIAVEMTPDEPIETMALEKMAEAVGWGTPLRLVKTADGTGFVFSVEG